MRNRLRMAMLAATVILIFVYVGSYYCLSRRAYAEADRFGMEGFYYFLPEDTDAWHTKNYACVTLFWPLNALDRWLGYGRYPAHPPLFGLSLLICNPSSVTNG